MKCNLPGHRISEALSHRIQFPHDISVRSCVYSQAPLAHMEIDVPFLREISHNTDRPHNAYGLHLPVSYLSEDKAVHHAAVHPLQAYNAHHWSQQVLFLSHDAFSEAAD